MIDSVSEYEGLKDFFGVKRRNKHVIREKRVNSCFWSGLFNIDRLMLKYTN